MAKPCCRSMRLRVTSAGPVPDSRPEAKLPRLSSASCEHLLGIASVLELPRLATYHLFEIKYHVSGRRPSYGWIGSAPASPGYCR